MVKLLMIDNYDSFTWNLADYLGRVFGEAPVVVRNDQFEWDENEVARRFDCIVVSPGPGSVERPGDFHLSRRAAAQTRLPVLGVCLGFQGIAYQYGCKIEKSIEPMHGRSSRITHNNDPLFAGIPQHFSAVRYHSLRVAEPLTDAVVPIARSDDGLLMALRHARLPKWGVQFHPESILSEYGLELLANFRDLTQKFHGRGVFPVPTTTPTSCEGTSTASGKTRLRVIHRKIQPLAGAPAIFAQLFAGQEYAFWLDSQGSDSQQARFSYMGAVAPDEVLCYSLSGDDADFSGARRLLARMDRELSETITEKHELPFCFSGGYIGFLTYNMKSVFEGEGRPENTIPDALWMRARRFVAIDHQDDSVWLVALCGDDEAAQGRDWLGAREQEILALSGAEPPDTTGTTEAPGTPPSIDMALSRQKYLAAIGECQRAIVAGDSYEICLTNQFSLQGQLDPLALYGEMRRQSPAPFGAFIKFGRGAVLSCSPERFLQVSAGDRIQTKPIKGTSRRSDDPAEDRQLAEALAASVKDRAENLMIVDLLRNDLNRVAVPGSVRVPKLAAIESYPGIHHMVSTIEARLRPDRSLMDLLAASFPGGSISGAPKIRSMQILDRLEPVPRGIFCGSIGFLGYNRRADLNIAIRTAAYDGERLRFGAGGAITHLSDPEEEFQEIMLKAEVILRPLYRYFTGEEGPVSFSTQGRRVHCRTG